LTSKYLALVVTGAFCFYDKRSTVFPEEIPFTPRNRNLSGLKDLTGLQFMNYDSTDSLRQLLCSCVIRAFFNSFVSKWFYFTSLQQNLLQKFHFK